MGWGGVQAKSANGYFPACTWCCVSLLGAAEDPKGTQRLKQTLVLLHEIIINFTFVRQRIKTTKVNSITTLTSSVKGVSRLHIMLINVINHVLKQEQRSNLMLSNITSVPTVLYSVYSIQFQVLLHETFFSLKLPLQFIVGKTVPAH